MQKYHTNLCPLSYKNITVTCFSVFTSRRYAAVDRKQKKGKLAGDILVAYTMCLNNRSKKPVTPSCLQVILTVTKVIAPN